MKLKIIRADLTKLEVDAIVNPTNCYLQGNDGIDGLIHRLCGEKLDKECNRKGHLNFGEAIITEAFKLPCKYIIHTAGPIWKNNSNNIKEKNILKLCYENSLKIALENKLTSIAFPLISTGHYGFPKDLAFEIACNTIHDVLSKYSMSNMEVYIVVYDQETFNIVFNHNIILKEDWINIEYKDIPDNILGEMENYSIVNSCNNLSQNNNEFYKKINEYTSQLLEICKKIDLSTTNIVWLNGIYKGTSASKGLLDYVNEVKNINTMVSNSLTKTCRDLTAVINRIEEIDQKNSLIKQEKSFSENLHRIIKIKNLKDIDVYTAAQQSKQSFSNSRKKDYQPSKNTVILYSLALKLNYKDTQKLLQSAGYYLSNSIPFDLIIKECILEGKYDIEYVNNYVYEKLKRHL